MQEGKKVQKFLKFQDIYPGTQRLSSRHTTTLSKIKNKFEHLYNQNSPDWFIIGKGICQFEYCDSRGQNSQERCEVSMTIQNGIIIAIKQIKQMQNIYISYNKWQQKSQQLTLYQSQYIDQLILNYKGKIQQLINISQQTQNLSKYLAQLYQYAISDMCPNKIKGAIIYINNQLHDNTFYQNQALLYAFYLSILKINNLVEEYDINNIILNIRKWSIQNKYPFHDKLIKYQRIFYYQNNKIQINNQLYIFNQSESNENIKRFIFFKLPEKQKLNFNKNKIQSYSIIEKIIQINAFNAQSEAIIEQPSLQLSQIQKLQSFLTKSKIKLQNQLNKYQQNIQFKHYACAMLNIVRNLDGVFYQKESRYFICLVSRNYAEVIYNISRQINNYMKKQQNSSKDILQYKSSKYGRNINKWGRNPKINELIFSSIPSLGISIMDPQTQIQLIW